MEPLSNRVEVTLRTSTVSSTSKSDIFGLDKLQVGDVISGRIKRVESFGLFITIENTNMVILHPFKLFVVHIYSGMIKTHLRAFSFLSTYNIY